MNPPESTTADTRRNVSDDEQLARALDAAADSGRNLTPSPARRIIRHRGREPRAIVCADPAGDTAVRNIDSRTKA